MRPALRGFIVGIATLGGTPFLSAHAQSSQLDHIRADLTVLSADSLQGRRTGTVGSRKAAEYIAKQMKNIGLEPGGDSGYIQRVPLEAHEGELTSLQNWDAYKALPADQRVVDGNVIGILRGTDPVLKDSVILVDAHYDHLGIGVHVYGDSIYNGADDDASGIVTVLQIARNLKAGPKLKRTVIFLATTGEEVGLLGTNWYVAHPAVPLTSMTANMEIEMVGRPDSLAGGSGKGWLTGFERTTMGKMFHDAGLGIVPDKRLSQHFFERSDNIAFAKHGIPAQTLSSFNLHGDYHQPSDEVSKIDFTHMNALVSAATKAVQLLANGPAPVWNPGGQP
jgi:hypothetical protein